MAKKRTVENTNKRSTENETEKNSNIYFILIYIYFICYLEKVTYIKGKEEKRKQ